jgi:hypothetical protein
MFTIIIAKNSKVSKKSPIIMLYHETKISTLGDKLVSQENIINLIRCNNNEQDFFEK